MIVLRRVTKLLWEMTEVLHTVKCFGIVNKAEVYVFLELSYFFDDPTDIGNLISGSSAFSASLKSIQFLSFIEPIFA